ncbi:MAG TPA: hypothetical protein VGQ30_14825 [Gemmatimonadaceae bacterium]|jgi:predicted dienelactone hydrolase|nr:hypothetical protein [Gemmatimonadaceae bacterium]
MRLTSLVAAMLTAATLSSQPGPVAPHIPPPTGRFPVGRVAYHWIDSSRTEPFTRGLDTPREVMVYVWYPAASGSTPHAAYIPDVDKIVRSIGETPVRAMFGAAFTAVVSGKVVSASLERASFSATVGRAPLLVFSPGFEESVLTYAAQVEDLASHGYIVAGIEHPYDSWATRFPDGRVIPFAQAPWDSAQREPNGAVAYQLAQIPPRADDIRFVLDRLVRLSATPSRAMPFAEHIDWTKVGAFGHSLGGVAAASACRSQTRIRACLNEDAEDDGRPYDGGVAAHVIKQPFLFFVSGHSIYASARTPAPTAETLRQMKLTRAQYDSMANQNQHNEEAAMAAMPGGSYLVMAEAPDFTHGTFMDRKLLQSGTDSIARRQDFYMGLVRTYVRAFFDQTLLSRPSSALNRAGVVDSLITIERFGRPSP